MKYIINSASTWGTDDFLDKYSDMLSKAGFKIQVLAQNDKYKSTVIINIKSLNDLMKLIDTVGAIVMRDKDILYEEYSTILIYDDYIE